MDIVVIILLFLILMEIERAISEVISKHNAMIRLIDSLNRIIGKIEKERDETNTKGREQKE